MASTTRPGESVEDPSAARFTLELPPNDVAATIARSALRRVFAFDDPDLESSFLVALTEIVINAIDEHLRNALDEFVTVEVVFGTWPHVRVIDRGIGFDAAHAGGAGDGAPQMEEGGRGLTLARAFVPQLTFEVSSTGTTVILPLDGFGVRR